MNPAELNALLLFGGMAFILAVVVVVSAVLAGTAMRKRGAVLGPWMLVHLMLAAALTVALSARNLSLPDIMLQAISDGDTETFGVSRWLNRAIILVLGCGALGLIANRAFARNIKGDVGIQLFMAYLLWTVLGNILPSIFGTQPYFFQSQLYPVMAVCWVCLSPRPDVKLVIRLAKGSMVALLVCSFLLAAVRPELVFQTNYKGWVPGMTIRFWGLASHANLIGPVALTLFALQYAFPSSRRASNLTVHSLAFGGLLLSQSKTNWIVMLFLWMVLRHSRPNVQKFFALSPDGRLTLRMASALLVVALLAVGGLLAVLVLDFELLSNRFVRTDIGVSIESGSGRTMIWALAIEEFQRSPIFGYGTTIWEAPYRLRHGLLSAFHAHNLYLQALSMSGSLGLFGLLVYLGLLVKLSLRYGKATRGLTLGLVLMLLIRSISEVPLPTKALFSLDTWLHLLLLLLIRAGQTDLEPAQGVVRLAAAPHPLSRRAGLMSQIAK